MALREALDERERPFEEPLVGLYHRADYSIRKLRAYFDNGRAGLDQEMAEILAGHQDAIVGDVFGIAGETDEEYLTSDT